MFNRRIAFIIYHYSLDRSPTILSGAAILAENGYQVDIILAYGSHRGVARESEGVSIIAASDRPVRGSHHRCQARLYQLLGLMSFLLKLVTIISKRRHSFLIGVEPYGLMAATLLGRVFRAPVAYWNLELTLATGKKSLAHFFEAWCNRQASFTIAQDDERAQVIIEENGIQPGSVLLVPTGARGPAKAEKTIYLRQRYNVPSDSKIVLYAGGINNQEFRCVDLARSTSAWPATWVLIIHGWLSDPNMLQTLQSAAPGREIIVSTSPVPYGELDGLLQSADIGVALYANLDLNHQLIGSASQKLSHYLKCGLPVITSDSPSLRAIVESYRCGVCVSDRVSPDEVAEAIAGILADYDEYVQGALRCFNERYDFDRFFTKVLERIDHEVSGRC